MPGENEGGSRDTNPAEFSVESAEKGTKPWRPIIEAERASLQGVMGLEGVAPVGRTLREDKVEAEVTIAGIKEQMGKGGSSHLAEELNAEQNRLREVEARVSSTKESLQTLGQWQRYFEETPKLEATKKEIEGAIEELREQIDEKGGMANAGPLGKELGREISWLAKVNQQIPDLMPPELKAAMRPRTEARPPETEMPRETRGVLEANKAEAATTIAGLEEQIRKGGSLHLEEELAAEQKRLAEIEKKLTKVAEGEKAQAESEVNPRVIEQLIKIAKGEVVTPSARLAEEQPLREEQPQPLVEPVARVGPLTAEGTAALKALDEKQQEIKAAQAAKAAELKQQAIKEVFGRGIEKEETPEEKEARRREIDRLLDAEAVPVKATWRERVSRAVSNWWQRLSPGERLSRGNNAEEQERNQGLGERLRLRPRAQVFLAALALAAVLGGSGMSREVRVVQPVAAETTAAVAASPEVKVKIKTLDDLLGMEIKVKEGSDFWASAREPFTKVMEDSGQIVWVNEETGASKADAIINAAWKLSRKENRDLGMIPPGITRMRDYVTNDENRDLLWRIYMSGSVEDYRPIYEELYK